ncbi:MAG: 3-dehydroquinate synthase [Actinobacteria bacterium]|nr:3-dehydroquinate synthase [Actinomycetota bacterium]MSZ12739.1 3-dehydroquinate synthase [Actinomycetota bacterium]MSZ27677.1 3-dehydroquinate synthase [Actinomycetota bacterium]
MRKLSIRADHVYEIQIDVHWREEIALLMQGRTKTAFITSSSFSPDLGDLLNLESEVHQFKVPDGEDGKTFATLNSIWNWLGAAGFTRNDLIVAIGGGALTDLSGFAAATWLRGIDWVAVPTSLAGMVDAAIGGKTAINSDFGKNLIGSFHSPVAVVIDPSWLKTLSDRDFSAGMAEVIKCGFIADPKILEIASDTNLEKLRADGSKTVDLVYRAAKVKAEVVSVDFKESFAREILNYGHTLGHAVEIHSKFKLRHGEAVSIGLVYAAELAAARSLISSEILAMHRNLLSNLSLPITYDRTAWPTLRPILALDKKSRGATIRFVTLTGLGSTSRLEDLTSNELDEAYERISS